MRVLLVWRFVLLVCFVRRPVGVRCGVRTVRGWWSRLILGHGDLYIDGRHFCGNWIDVRLKSSGSKYGRPFFSLSDTVRVERAVAKCALS